NTSYKQSVPFIRKGLTFDLPIFYPKETTQTSKKVLKPITKVSKPKPQIAISNKTRYTKLKNQATRSHAPLKTHPQKKKSK
ncbi:hypothetical protein OFM39_33825, partial [Escherichia coli]|nr:hypothetical protein [Escherichia coli]